MDISSGVLHAFAQVTNDISSGSDTPADKSFTGPFSSNQSASTSGNGTSFNASASVSETVSASASGITINGSGSVSNSGLPPGSPPTESASASGTIGLTVSGSQLFAVHSEAF